MQKDHSNFSVTLTVLMVVALLSVFASSPSKANDPVPVKVGAYEYGVVYYYENDKPGGIVPLLINRLNKLQNQYVFQLVETSSRRRYQDLDRGEVDLVLLENSQWEWHAFDVDFSAPIVREKDLYVTLSNRTDIEHLFGDITGHPILCVLGFHYGFAGNNADPEYLYKNFDVLLRYNEGEVLDGLIAGEAPIGIVSAGFLARQFVANPGLRNRVVFSDQPDATYDLVSVLSKNASIPLDDFNRLIARLLESGEIERLWQQLHIGVSENTGPA